MILDKNCWGDLLKKTTAPYPDPDMEPIHNWLKKRNGKLVYSKQIMTDGGKSKKMTLFMKEKSDAGQAKRIDSAKVEKAIKAIKEISIEKKYTLKSNDIHILGLAKASDTKLLCSSDKKLHQDFKHIIKGNIYQNKTHNELLTRDICP